jgi:hypothetical protein
MLLAPKNERQKNPRNDSFQAHNKDADVAIYHAVKAEGA